MRRMLEFGQFPKGFTRDAPCKEVFDIIPNFVVGHWPFDNIVGMRFTMTTRRHEVEPFVRHHGKQFLPKFCIRLIVIDTDNMRFALGHSPTSCLFLNLCTIEAIPKVLRETDYTIRTSGFTATVFVP